MDKHELMEQLEHEARAIEERFCAPGVNLVWGEGDLDAPMMLIGEAPGAQEDLLGRPFVGASGKLLDSELELAGISRERVYITGAVKCRPTNARSGRVSNRAPTKEEIAIWRGALLRQIEIISPKVILCLGAVAASDLIHPGFRMVEERGKWFDGPFGTRVMTTFHPAYIYRWRRRSESHEHQLFRTDLKTAAAAAFAT